MKVLVTGASGFIGSHLVDRRPQAPMREAVRRALQWQRSARPQAVVG